MSDEAREAIEAAYEEVDKNEPAEPAASPATPAPTPTPTPTPTPAESGTPTPTDVPGTPTPTPTPTPAESGTPTPTADPAADPAAAPADKKDRAPQSWNPTNREAWAALPENVKEQVLKREREVEAALADSSTSRKDSGEYNKMLQPFDAMFAAQGVDRVAGVNNILHTAAALQGGTIDQKAGTIAKLISDFGVDIKTLDGMLSGQHKATPDTPQMKSMQQKMDGMEKFIRQSQQNQYAQQQQQRTTVNTEVADFVKANEFAPDLRNTMADFMDIAEKNGGKLTLQEAYDRALTTRPDIQAILATRSKAPDAAAAVAAAKAANVSAPPSNEAAPAADPGASGDLRDTISNLWEDS